MLTKNIIREIKDAPVRVFDRKIPLVRVHTDVNDFVAKFTHGSTARFLTEA